MERRVGKLSLVIVGLLLCLSVLGAAALLWEQQKRLEITQATVEATLTKLEAVELELTTQRRDNQQLTARYDGATSALSSTTQRMDALQQAHEQLLEEQEATVRENEDYQGEIVHLTRELATAKATAIRDNEIHQAEVGRLAAKHADLDRRHKDLLAQSGSVGQLQGEADDLTKRIAALKTTVKELEEKRRPLILRPQTSFPLCTGSMEPVITCLDSITMLKNFQPEDITVGTIISFAPPAECDLEGRGYILHRVTQIKVGEGGHYYRTKGDARESDDGCWIPETKVTDYLIGLQKNAHPENQGLREWVNRAKGAADTARALYETAWETYEASREVYLLEYARYCGDAPSGTCRLTGDRFDELMALHQEHLDLYEKHLTTLNAYRGALEHHECWVDSALNALYLPGQVPIYSMCIGSGSLPTRP